MRNSLAALIFLGLAGGACASRSVPEREPPRSPASLAGTAGPAATVTTALDGDPPLPGEPEGAWNGLREQRGAPTGDAHAGHEHHGAGEPAPVPKEHEHDESEHEDHESKAPQSEPRSGHEHHHHHEAPDATH